MKRTWRIRIDEIDAEEFFGAEWPESEYVRRDADGMLVRGIDFGSGIRFRFEAPFELEGPGRWEKFGYILSSPAGALEVDETREKYEEEDKYSPFFRGFATFSIQAWDEEGRRYRAHYLQGAWYAVAVEEEEEEKE